MLIKPEALRRKKPELQEEWCEYQDGVRFLIRGISHKYVQVGLAAKYDQQAKLYARINSGDKSALKLGKAEDEIGLEMMGELVIADWSGLMLESGEELPYSEDVAVAILENEDYKDLAVWVLAEATRISKEVQDKVNQRLGKS